LNKIYLAASKLKIAETANTTYNFVQNDSFFSYCFFNYYNYHNPQGLNIIIAPTGLFKSFSKEIIIYSFSQQQLNLKQDTACKF